MIDKDVDLEGVSFRTPHEQDLHIRGQRELAISKRAKSHLVAKEANDTGRAFLYKAAKLRQRAFEKSGK